MTHPFGFQLGKKYVCVSTVGPSPAHIRALEPLPARLAWSVHAADDKLRKLLVPTTRHTMAELRDAWGVCAWIYGYMDACVHVYSRAELRDRMARETPGCNPTLQRLQPPCTRAATPCTQTATPRCRRGTRGAARSRADGGGDAHRRCQRRRRARRGVTCAAGAAAGYVAHQPHPTLQPHASRLQPQPRVSGKTRINLIPYNANAGLGAAGRLFLPSPPEAVQAFHARLIDLGVICTVRVPRGNEEDSACGMLRVTKGGSGVD